MKKIFRIALLIIFAVLTVSATAAAIFLIVPTKLELNTKSLENNGDFIDYYDRHNNKITTVSSGFSAIDISEVSEMIKNVFIASEDKNFYRHNGLDHLGMIRAAFKNLISGKYVQGASTISQQLIKNTQLSGEKTLKRKLDEIKLTQKLEKLYSKDEILTMYLNKIYFGENRYGIESASKFYFNKSSGELDLNEATLLAATIRSPSAVNPLKNYDMAKTYQKTVLSRMLKIGYIDEKTFNETLDKNAVIYGKSDDTGSCYIKAVFNELTEELDLDPYEIRNCSVYTDFDEDLQRELENSAKNREYDEQIMVADNKTHLINAYYTTCGEILRHPASIIKPLAIYAPLIEKDVITECTVVKDEITNIDGYSPVNYKNKYYGDVTVADALKVSLNVPAVKLLNVLGVDESEKYLKKLGIPVKNAALNLAVGHIDGGVKLKQLVGAYSSFPNNGNYSPVRFIKKIVTFDERVVYEQKKEEERVFSQDTCEVITDILRECASSGTAKKLKKLGFDVAAKTGTFGNENGNSDAYTVSYTTDKTVAAWIGNADGALMDNSVTGGGKAAELNAEILGYIYKNDTPKNFDHTETITLNIDGYVLKTDGRIMLADENTPEKYVVKGLFKNSCRPVNTSTAFSSAKVDNANVSLIDKEINIVYDKPDFCKVKIYRKSENEKRLVYEGFDCVFKEILNEGTYEYSIIPIVKGKNISVSGEEITLPKVTVNSDLNHLEPLPDNWWNDE